MPKFKSRYLLHILVLIGIFLRLHYYLANPSVSCDEAWVIEDTMYQSFSDIIFKPFPHPTPPGFNFLIKLQMTLGGLNELNLRLFSLFASLLSLILFLQFLKNIGSNSFVLTMAYAFFAFSENLINYAAIVKPYTNDVFMALILWLTFYPFLKRKNISFRDMIMLALVGSAAVWFSFPTIFILAGAGSVFFISRLREKDFKNLTRLGVIISAWLFNFMVLYHKLFSSLTESTELDYFWTRYFPSSSLSWQNLTIILEKTIAAFNNPGGLTLPYIAFFVALIGFFNLRRKDATKAWFLISPLLAAFLAFLLKKYPFHERLILFLLPVLYLMVAEGIDCLHSKGKKLQVASLLLCALFLILPLERSRQSVLKPDLKDDIRPVMQQLVKYLDTSDVVCVNMASQWSFWYYLQSLNSGITYQKIGLLADQLVRYDSSTYGLMTVVEFRLTPEGKFQEVHFPGLNLKIEENNTDVFPRNSRTWFLFSRASKELEEFILQYLDKIGRKTAGLKSQGSSLYLYDLSLPRDTAP